MFMSLVGKCRELVEQTRKNRRDKKFWTMLHKSILKYEQVRLDRIKRTYRKRDYGCKANKK